MCSKGKWELIKGEQCSALAPLAVEGVVNCNGSVVNFRLTINYTQNVCL